MLPHTLHACEVEGEGGGAPETVRACTHVSTPCLHVYTVRWGFSGSEWQCGGGELLHAVVGACLGALLLALAAALFARVHQVQALRRQRNKALADGLLLPWGVGVVGDSAGGGGAGAAGAGQGQGQRQGLLNTFGGGGNQNQKGRGGGSGAGVFSAGLASSPTPSLLPRTRTHDPEHPLIMAGVGGSGGLGDASPAGSMTGSLFRCCRRKTTHQSTTSTYVSSSVTASMWESRSLVGRTLDSMLAACGLGRLVDLGDFGGEVEAVMAHEAEEGRRGRAVGAHGLDPMQPPPVPGSMYGGDLDAYRLSKVCVHGWC